MKIVMRVRMRVRMMIQNVRFREYHLVISN